MWMTDEEICQMYREAKNKAKQIKILADLNICSAEDIRDVLRAHGIAAKIRRAPNNTWTEEEIALCRTLLEEGYTYKQIAVYLPRRSWQAIYQTAKERGWA